MRSIIMKRSDLLVLVQSHVLLISLLTRSSLQGDLHHENNGPREYCLTKENFEATCLKNEVILIRSAVYGRMRIGRCLEAEVKLLTGLSSDPMFLGCFVDVLRLLHGKCSGRNHCLIIGSSDADLKGEQPCHAALNNYLEVEYECISVIEEDRSCTVSVSSSPLHIMRSSVTKPSCGTKSQPWILQAPVGQSIAINFIDFEQATEDYVPSHQPCLEYGYILDESGKNKVSICQNVKQKLDIESRTNLVQLVFRSDLSSKTDGPKFVVGFKAVGCTDVIPPLDAWLRRNGNEAVVGCYTVRQTWHLRCVNNKWIGVMGNCTRDEKEYPADVLMLKDNGINYSEVMVIITIGFVCFIICLFAICCGPVLLKRYYVNMGKKYFHRIDEIEKQKFQNTIAQQPLA